MEDEKSTEHTSSVEVSKPVEDITAIVVGDFGKWQLWISILMSLLKLCGAWYQLNIIFMAPPQDFWCKKPPAFRKYSEEDWRKICAPKIEEFPCMIFDPDMLAMAPNIDRSLIPLVPCKNFVYDTSVFKRTITADWDLVCDKHWMVHITQCVMMTGVLLGGLFFGMFADKYGRKRPLMYAIIIQAVASFIASFLPYYWWFLFVWFILALASGGITIISFVLCMEAVSGKWRTVIPVLYQLPFGLGNTVMAVLAYYLRDWRKLEIALAALSSLYILYWCWIPESPRWLIANGQMEEAVDELYRAAKLNKRDWKKEDIRRLMPKSKPQHPEPPTFREYLKYPSMRLKTILLSLNWLLTGIAFYTFSQYLGGIGGNIFVTVAVTGAISAPGPIVCVFVVAKTGRKTTVWIFQFLTAVCFVVIYIMPKEAFGTDWPRLTFAGIGFAAMAASVPTLYLYSGELYPTLGRNRGVGGVTMFARVGSMLAPFIVTLESIMEDLPLIFLAITSFGQMILLLPLPETKNQPLPDTIEEAERFVKVNKQLNKQTDENKKKKDTKIQTLLKSTTEEEYPCHRKLRYKHKLPKSILMPESTTEEENLYERKTRPGNKGKEPVKFNLKERKSITNRLLPDPKRQEHPNEPMGINNNNLPSSNLHKCGCNERKCHDNNTESLLDPIKCGSKEEKGPNTNVQVSEDSINRAPNCNKPPSPDSSKCRATERICSNANIQPLLPDTIRCEPPNESKEANIRK